MFTKKQIQEAKKIRKEATQKWNCAESEIYWPACVALACKKEDILEKSMEDFATYAEYTQYRRELEIAQKGSTIVTLSDGSTVEVVGKEYDLNELERSHDSAIMRDSKIVGPAPENGWYWTDEQQF